MTEKTQKKQDAVKSGVNWDAIAGWVKGVDKKIKKYDYFQLLSFEKTYALSAIKVFYWIGLVAILVQFVLSLFAASSFMGFMGTLIALPLGFFILRIFCELLMVSFGVYNRLGEIKDLLSKK